MREQLGANVVSRGGRTVSLLGELASELEVLAANGEILQPIDLDRPLLGLEDAGGAGFGHWVDRARVRLRREARATLAGELSAARARGDVNRVYERAAQLYRVDPTSDAAVRALSERMLLEGDTVGTVQLLRSHVARLSEAGVASDAGLHRFLTLVERGLVRVQRIDRTAPKASQLRQPEVFLGREGEMSRLESLWGRALGGSLTTCLIAGPAGIGKSSLLKRFSTSMASRSAAVWEVACQEIGRNIPFAFVSELFHALGRDPVVGGTDPRWLAEASRVTPGLQSAYPGIPEPPPAPAEAIRLRLAEALLRMIEVVADGGPILLAIDDLAYLDPASRDILHLLFRRLAPMPALVVASARTVEEHRITAAEDGCDTGFHWDEVLDLNPLPAGPSRAVVQGLANATTPRAVFPDDVIRVVVELAQGNPYLIEMLVSDWRRDPALSLVAAHAGGDGSSAMWRPPETMRKAFDRQYRGVSPDAERLLNLLAVAGRTMPAAEIGTLLDLSTSEADGAALELLDRGIVRMEDGGLQFKNQLHRSFVYYAMSEGWRKFLHGRTGTRLITGCDTSQFRRALEASHHFAQASMHSSAYAALDLAASSAIDGGGAREAERATIRLLKTETARDTESRLWLLLGRAHEAQGRYHDGLIDIEKLDEISLDRSDRAELSLVRAKCVHRARLGDDDAIRSAVEGAVTVCREIGTDSNKLAAIQLAVEYASESGDTERLAALVKIATCIGNDSDDDRVQAMANMTTAYCALVSGTPKLACEVFAKSIGHMRSAGYELEHRRALNGLGISQQAAGLFHKAVKSFGLAARLAEKIGDLDGAANSWSNLGAVSDDLGDFGTSGKAYERSVEVLSTVASNRRLAEVAINIAGLAMTVGEPVLAGRVLEQASDAAMDATQWRLEVDVLCAQADCALASDNPEQAWALYERAEWVRQRRLYLLADMGRYERLRRHHIWATRGYEAMRRLNHSAPLSQTCTQISDYLEARVFEEWVEQREIGSNGAVTPACEELARRGLEGVFTKLNQLGINVAASGTKASRDGHAAVESGDTNHTEAVSACLRLVERLALLRTN
jgi:tetratricopeptide (TPR) repeat protein